MISRPRGDLANSHYHGSYSTFRSSDGMGEDFRGHDISEGVGGHEKNMGRRKETHMLCASYVPGRVNFQG